MARKYNQDCLLAHALDLLGERWTLLIIQDLFLGPQRFGDLQAGLPGIGANLLSKRLKELDEAGIIVAPKPTEARGRYRLSETGEELRAPVREMMFWSVKYFMERPDSSPAQESIFTDNLLPDSVALAIELFAHKISAPVANYIAHVQIDDYPYTLYQMNGAMTARRGADSPAVLRIAGDVATFMQAFRGELGPEETRARLEISGDEMAAQHIVNCMAHKYLMEQADGEKQMLATAL